MRSIVRVAGLSGALLAAALIGGTLIGSVLAAPPPPAEVTAPASEPARHPGVPRDGTYCRTYRAAFAAELGVTEADVVAARKAAAVATVDAALAAGDLTEARADRIKARIAEADGDACSRIVDRIGERRDHAGRSTDR